MGDAIVVVGGLASALILAWLARARRRRAGPAVDISGLIVGPGAVIFTKDDCSTCVGALARVVALGLPVRQIRAEDEPAVLEARGVDGVPITVLISRAGTACGQFAGLPPQRALRRAAKRAREIPGGVTRDL